MPSELHSTLTTAATAKMRKARVGDSIEPQGSHRPKERRESEFSSLCKAIYIEK